MRQESSELRREHFTTYGSLARLPEIVVAEIAGEAGAGGGGGRTRLTSKQSWQSYLITTILFLVSLLGLCSFFPSSFIFIRREDAAETSFEEVSHPMRRSSTWGGIHPVPTGAWWTNVALEAKGDIGGEIFVDPYALRMSDSGLELSYSADNREISKGAIVDAFVNDFLFKAVEETGTYTRKVSNAGHLHMHFEYLHENGGKMTALLARGSPYITVEYNFLRPLLDVSIRGLLSVEISPKNGIFQRDQNTHTRRNAASSSCIANTACSNLGLQGQCCPDARQQFLDCCSSNADSEYSDDSTKNSIIGRIFLVHLKNKSKWILITSQVMKWSWDSSSGKLWLDVPAAPEKIIIRVARVLSETGYTVLHKNGNIFPIGSSVTWQKHSTTMNDFAILNFHWEVDSLTKQEDKLAKLVTIPLPHHLKALERWNGDLPYPVECGLSYTSIKGMRRCALLGSEWNMTYELTNISFRSPSRIDESLAAGGILPTDDQTSSNDESSCAKHSSCVALGLSGACCPTPSNVILDCCTSRQLSFQKKTSEVILDALRRDVKISPAAEAVYGFGKQAARLALMSIIADQIEADSEEKPLMSTEITLSLVRALRPWIEGTNKDKIVFDKTYGGLVTSEGLEDKNADFGNGWYNDHHYHYGYLVYAIATVLHMENKNGGSYMSLREKENLKARGLQLVLDICNPIKSSGSEYSSSYMSEDFPTARHKDFWDGHSWASGLEVMMDGKSQESVSESANSYYAVSLFARAVIEYTESENLISAAKELLDFSRLLLAMEVDAAKAYWQILDAQNNQQIYPQEFTSYRMAGVVGASDVSLSTWFGSQSDVEYTHCINMIPFTPMTELLLSTAFVEVEYPVLEERLKSGLVSPQWEGFIFQDQAIVDKVGAWRNAIQLYKSSYGILDEGSSWAAILYWIATRKNPWIATRKNQTE